MDKSLITSLSWRGEKLLKRNIQANEQILLKVKGAFGQGLVITNKMIYILKWGYMTGNIVGGKCISYEFFNITGIHLKKGWLTGTFEILRPATQQSNKGYWSSGEKAAWKSDNIITFTLGYK